MELLSGSATSVLLSGVSYLDLPLRFSARCSMGGRRSSGRGFEGFDGAGSTRSGPPVREFSNEYLWQWQLAEVERSSTRCARVIARWRVDARGYRTRCGCSATTSWTPLRLGHRVRRSLRCCAGADPARMEPITHVNEYEGRPDDAADLRGSPGAFDAADGRAEQIRARGRKGALAALRDAALLKTVYGYGLRRQEVVGLDLADLQRRPRLASAGSVRCSSGSASRPRAGRRSGGPY